MYPPKTVSDIDGNEYQTVQIGDQVWMAENLKTTRYADGTPMVWIKDSNEYHELSVSVRTYSWYDNNPSLGEVYGALYNWTTVVRGVTGSDANPSGLQGVCPDGWHVPSVLEWQELEAYVGSNPVVKLKEEGFEHWEYPDDGTNDYGFTALPAGYRDDRYARLGTVAYFWTSTPSAENGRSVVMGYGNENLGFGTYFRNDGFSIRCVKD